MLFPQFYFNNYAPACSQWQQYHDWQQYLDWIFLFINDNNVATLLSVLFACSTYHDINVEQFLLVLQFLSLDLYILQHNLLCIFSTRLPALPCYTIRHLYPKPIDTALCLNWHGYSTFNTLIAKPVLKRILFCIKFAYRAQELKDYVSWRYFFHLTRDYLLVEMKNKNISRLTGLILLSSSDAG